MVNIKTAISFIKDHGDDIEKARMKCILVGGSAQVEIAEKLAEMQHSDGGFSYWIKDISTVFDTVYVLSWLDDLAMRSGNVVERAFEFLISHQQQDGGWDEVEAIRGLDTPTFLVPGEINTRVFITAYAAHWFVRFGRAEPPEARGCPMEFLKAHQVPSGLIMDDLQTTWDSLVLFSYHPGLNSELYEKTFKVIQKKFTPDTWKGSNLTYLLCCLRDVGLPIKHPFVNLCIDELIQKQQPAGNWDSEYGEEYATSTTIEAIRVLKHYKVV